MAVGSMPAALQPLPSKAYVAATSSEELKSSAGTILGQAGWIVAFSMQGGAAGDFLRLRDGSGNVLFEALGAVTGVPHMQLMRPVPFPANATVATGTATVGRFWYVLKAPDVLAS